MFISYKNYKGGINNLIVASDNAGNVGTSQKSVDQALKNLERNKRRNARR